MSVGLTVTMSLTEAFVLRPLLGDCGRIPYRANLSVSCCPYTESNMHESVTVCLRMIAAISDLCAVCYVPAALRDTMNLSMFQVKPAAE